VPAAEQALPVSSAEAADLFADLAPCEVLVIAVSGGPDSTALMVLAARWRSAMRRGPKLVAVTVDHGLRPESASEAAAVKRLAGKLGIVHRTARWVGKKPSTGIQAAGRRARYRLLAMAARQTGARHILTAHTLDDQAETVLIRLSRGSGITGLAGMARVSGLGPEGDLTAAAPPPALAARVASTAPDACRSRIGCLAPQLAPEGRRSRGTRPRRIESGTTLVLVRPFLAISKARLVATLKAEKIPFLRDPSNSDPRFARARLRNLMPVLAAEGIDSARLAQLARRAARSEGAVETAVAEALPRVSLTEWSNSGPILLDLARLGDLPAEVVLRLLGRAIGAVGNEGPVELGKLEALLEAAGRKRDAGRFRRTLAGAVITVDRGRLAVERAPARRQRGLKTARK